MFKYPIGLLILLTCKLAFAWPEMDMQQFQDNGYIVGMGVAESRAGAKNEALAEIVSQLSINVRVNQTHSNVKRNSTTETVFKQQIGISSLPFELVGVEEIDSSSNKNNIAVVLGIKKAHLINSLKDELNFLSKISLPDSSVQYRFIHALENQAELNRAAKILPVLELLDGEQRKLSSTLSRLQTDFQQALNQVSSQVIDNSSPSELIAAIDNKLKWSGKTLIWVKPQLNWRYASSNQIKHVQAHLAIKFTHTVSPFNTLKEYSIITTASGDTIESAKEAAIKQLVDIVNRPIRQWNSE
ncbi:hypothetical protein SOPP22_10015 [Shewanella sp. OPT22]|nr:hypothetical protein SOPP22_10015 [Shewanella sp. OPT22]